MKKTDKNTQAKGKKDAPGKVAQGIWSFKGHEIIKGSLVYLVFDKAGEMLDTTVDYFEAVELVKAQTA